MVHSGSFNLSFKGEYIIYENDIRCNLTEDEFNFTLNPSANISGSVIGFVSSSVFNPYMTTIGLYNEARELLAVGKLSQPIQIPRNNDICFVIRYDT